MIPIQDARSVFTNQLLAKWNELSELAPKTFLGSFFTKQTTDAKEVSIEVMRGTEKIAVDVLRGSDGNRNAISKFSEKIFVPPFYDEFLDMTSLDKYDLIWGMGAGEVSAKNVTSAIQSALEKVNTLKYKIERAYELQRSQVFQSGIVTLNSGDNIDFKRKAASSVVNTAGQYWSNSNVDPREQLKASATFLRTVGKASDGIFNVVMGINVISAFFKNPFIINDSVKDVRLIDLQLPQTNAMGGVFHGQISCGAYLFNIWSYPEYYDNSAGVSTPYIADDNIVVLPVNSGKYIMSYAGVPAVVRNTGNSEVPEFITSIESDYVIYNQIEKKSHIFGVMSAGLAIPVSVDRIYSATVTGTANVG